jgi:hypothetical protein
MAEEREFDTRFRPLVASTAGAGLVALAVFDFAANAWDAVALADSRTLIAAAARTAFLSFLLTAAATIYAFLMRSGVGARLGLAINLFGAGLFLGGTFLSGRLLSEMFTLEAPAASEPPAAVGVFFGVAVLAMLALATVALWPSVRAYLSAARDWLAGPSEIEEEEVNHDA